jgi:hypothetical protein
MIPIVLIHIGNAPYLEYSIAQAKISNRRSPIILIGDEECNRGYPDAEFFLMNQYVKEALEFSKVYRHMNTNREDFELVCFVRWFILLSFMREHGLGQVVYIDSDIMLYENMNYEHYALYEYDLAIAGIAPPALINNIDALDAFCAFTMQCYTDPELLAWLEKRFEQMQSNGQRGGNCDMTIWELFRDRTDRRLYDLGQLRQGAIYDKGILLSEGFEMDGMMKRIEWHDGQPYGKLLAGGGTIRFKGLHFQSYAKKYMADFLSGDK